MMNLVRVTRSFPSAVQKAIPMSSFAQRQLEKMGWTAGKGLGKNGTGVTTFLKVQKRATGLQSGIGHEASNPGSRVDDMGFEGALKAFHKPHLKKLASKKKSNGEDGSSTASDDEEEAKPKKKLIGGSKRARDDSDEEADDTVTTKPSGKGKKRVEASSSEEDSSSEEGHFEGGIQNIDDAELFKRCGGVRLSSRAGKHRFFTAKQKRCNMDVVDHETTTKAAPKKK